ncbi:MAG: CHRD domain-containing protein [Gemmatimonadaceae bacterium]
MVSACDNKVAPPVTTDPRVPSSIALAESSTGTLTSAGDTRTITAVVKNPDGAVVAAPDIQWSSSAPGVASVAVTAAGSATVTAVGDGTAIITARSGSVQSTTEVAVHRAMVSITLTKPMRVLEWGMSEQLVATALDARHNAIPDVQGFKFSSDDPASVFVQPDGVATAVFKFPLLGDAVITASLTRDGVSAIAKVTLVVSEPVETDYGALLLADFIQPGTQNAHGSGIALMNRLADRIAYRAIWSGLSGSVTSVTIRGPSASTENGDLLVNLLPLPTLDSLGLINSSITSANIRSQNGRAPISLDSLGALLCNRQLYVEVRTIRFPAGELRGRLGCFE